MKIKLLIVKLINTLLGIMMIWMVSVSAQANIYNCSSVYEVTATQLNVRSQPKTPSDILGTVKRGDKICVDSFNGKWAKTEYGWISGKYLRLIEQDIVETQQTNISDTNTNNVPENDIVASNKSGDSSGLLVILAVIIILSIIFFALKTFFYHSIISLGLAETDGRSKNGIRLTRLGKFMKGILWILIIFIFLLIWSLSK